MIFGAMWDYIYFNDAYDEETNSDGVYVPSGTNPEKEYSQGKNDMLNGGIKIRVFDGTFGQESYNLSQKVQPNGTNASFIFSDLILQIDEFTEYTMPTLDTSKSLVSIRTTGEASKGTAEITYGKEIDWYVAAKTEGRSTVNEYYYATDEKVGTGKTVSKEFTENGDLTVIGVDGAYRIVKTLSARIYSAIVTLQDADGNMIETFYVADSNETITLPKLDKRGHRYELSTEQVSGFTQDTTITVTYTMIHGITFKKDGKKIGTAIVDHGKGVEASQIPTVEVPEGKILTWDADLTNITEDLIVNAVLSDKPVEQTTTEAEQPAEKKGCGSTLGVSALVVVLVSTLGMGLKRKH